MPPVQDIHGSSVSQGGGAGEEGVHSQLAGWETFLVL